MQVMMLMHVIVAGGDVMLLRRWRVVMHIKRMRVLVIGSAMQVRHVGQSKAQLLPEELVAPLQVRVCL